MKETYNNSPHLPFSLPLQNADELCRYLGDPAEIAKAAQAVANQGKGAKPKKVNYNRAHIYF